MKPAPACGSHLRIPAVVPAGVPAFRYNYGFAGANCRHGMYLYPVISGLMSMRTWLLVLLPIFLHAKAWSSQRIGMAHGTYYPSLSSIAAERFHPLHAGQGMSICLSASALGMFIGAPVWGTITDRAGHEPMFLLAGLAMTAGTIAFVAAQDRARHTLPWSEERALE